MPRGTFRHPGQGETIRRGLPMAEQDYYEILGVGRDASDEDIKKILGTNDLRVFKKVLK